MRRHGGVFALVLEMLEEGDDRARVDLLQRQRGWLDVEPLGGEQEQLLEAQGIRVARMPANAPLAGKCPAQERLDEGSNGRHEGLPQT